MDQAIQIVYSLPVVGIVAQLIGYFLGVLPNIAPIILRSATPIALAGLCGVLCER